MIFINCRFREFIRTNNEEPTATPRGPAPFPTLKWANRQELWNLMVKKETGMYVRQTGQTLMARNPVLQPGMRALLLDWLMEVCEVYKLHRETFYLSADYIDRFLGSSRDIPKDRLQLIGKLIVTH